MFLFSYRVLVYDTIEEENKVKSGIIFGENFTNAVERLENHYGDLNEVKGLKILCDMGAIELNEMTVENIEEDLKDYVW
jgi:hypothetical protein